ncbi:MAG: hypothetical protein V5A23_01350 [Halobacteriales archaeon]
MPGETTTRAKCRNCGFEPEDSDAWGEVVTPTLGTMTRCPECGSTDVRQH